MSQIARHNYEKVKAKKHFVTSPALSICTCIHINYRSDLRKGLRGTTYLGFQSFFKHQSLFSVLLLYYLICCCWYKCSFILYSVVKLLKSSEKKTGPHRRTSEFLVWVSEQQISFYRRLNNFRRMVDAVWCFLRLLRLEMTPVLTGF